MENTKIKISHWHLCTSKRCIIVYWQWQLIWDSEKLTFKHTSSQTLSSLDILGIRTECGIPMMLIFPLAFPLMSPIGQLWKTLVISWIKCQYVIANVYNNIIKMNNRLRPLRRQICVTFVWPNLYCVWSISIDPNASPKPSFHRWTVLQGSHWR